MPIQIPLSPAECAGIVAAITEQAGSQSAVVEWKRRLGTAEDAFERAVLIAAMPAFEPRIGALPVHEEVQDSLRREYARIGLGAGPRLLTGTDPFVAAAKLVSLRRFPAGPLDWVISGMPRSWLRRIPVRSLPRVLRYIAREFGGFRPAFYVHVAHPPRNRALVIEREVLRAYYRMVKSLELQPEMKGILCAGWFHDPAMLAEYPHLGPVNAPYVHFGGRVLATVGDAPRDSGFLDNNPERRRRYDAGELRVRLGLAMWPRRAAIAWAAENASLRS